MRDFHCLLVTGGCGFIGSHFIRSVLHNPQFQGRIINLDKLTYAGNPANLADVERDFPQRYRLVQGDVADAELVGRLLREEGVDGVVHLAAESHVDRSIRGPAPFIMTNVVGTFTLLEAALEVHRSGQSIHFHHVSTDEVFGSLGPEGFFTETTPYDPRSPYSASKAASDHLVRAWGHTYNLSITVSNCCNNYGPYHFPEKLIPLALVRMMNNQPVPIYGDGQNVRDWLYVEDHAEALWLVLTRGRSGESYNVGARCERTNLDLLKTLCQILAEESGRSEQELMALLTFVPDRPGHDRRYAIDPSKIERELGWRPRHTLEEGLRKTVRWYLHHTDWIRSVQSGAYREWISAQYGAALGRGPC